MQTKAGIRCSVVVLVNRNLILKEGSGEPSGTDGACAADSGSVSISGPLATVRCRRLAWTQSKQLAESALGLGSASFVFRAAQKAFGAEL